jgi:uncharacterized OB-fold protein
MSRTPWGNDKPERRAERAASHYCSTVGSTLFAPRDECPYCSDRDEEDETDE